MDIDECSSEIDVCFTADSAQNCQNLNGSFICECADGFAGENVIGSPANCENIDECLDNPCGSGSNQHCEDSHGGNQITPILTRNDHIIYNFLS